MAGMESISLPALEEWKRDVGAELKKQEKVLVPTGGNFAVAKTFPAKYGETIGITLLYSGKGRIQVQINEYDAEHRQIANTAKPFFNEKNETHSRSAYFSISKKETQSFSIEIQGAGNEGLGIGKIECVHLFGEENELYSPYCNMDLWRKRTQGRNLASGRKVSFMPEPNYEPTRKGDSDATDLTDGKLSTKYGDYIWFDKEAVGWNTSEKQCLFSIDLGKVCNVGKAVVRVCGGRMNAYSGYGMFPELFQVWISKDGEKWHAASSLKKVKINE